jgi:hypothetical protein
MEICQHCDMYMKPFVSEDKKSLLCEFCGEIVVYKGPKGENIRPEKKED